MGTAAQRDGFAGLGGRPDPNLLFSTLIGDSYSYFYGSSKSASQIIRQNVTINALKEGITSYAARNGDSASLVNLATTSSMEKQRLAHVSIGHVAMRTLPMTQTILTGIAIGIFPLLVLAAVFNKLTLSVLKGYVFALMWLQSWPLLYAILNSAMTFYAKQNGAPVVLSEISQIQLKYSDLASTAGYAKAHNISNEQATQELASRSTRASAGMYGDAHAEWGVKPKILGVGGGLGVRGGGRAGIDWSDDDAHQASSGSRASYDARHDIDAKASKDFKEASDYFTSRKVSESGSHTDNNADSRVDQLSAALNSAKQSYDQYTTNMTRSHEYAESGDGTV